VDERAAEAADVAAELEALGFGSPSITRRARTTSASRCSPSNDAFPRAEYRLLAESLPAS
jgi:hypothetical protein